jgi:predicted RecA/RadA family phage recombinase
MINYSKFSRAYDQKYKIVERKQIRSWSKFYKDKYFSTINEFLTTGRTDFPFLFKKEDWLKAYKFLYVRVGMSMANWYFNNFEKFATKDLETKNYQTTWELTFAQISARIGSKRITGLTANQRSQLNSLYLKLTRDPSFMALGVPEQTRIIRKQLTYLSKVQATRIVRTETTTASNMAMRESALTMFDKSSLNKTWQSSFLPTSRDGHMELDGETIPEHEQFLVLANDGKADLMSFPGDPAGSAGNVCNCTCKVFYIPKTYNERVVGGDLVDVGFGLVSNTAGGAGALVSTGVARILPTAGGSGSVAVNQAVGTGSQNVRLTDDVVPGSTKKYDNLSTPMRDLIKKYEDLGMNSEFLNVFQRSPNMKKLFLRFGKKAKFFYDGLKGSNYNPILYMRNAVRYRLIEMNTLTHEFGHVLSSYFNITTYTRGVGYVVNNPIFKRVIDKLNLYTDARMRGMYQKAGQLMGSRIKGGLNDIYLTYYKNLRTMPPESAKKAFEISLRKYYGDDVYEFYKARMLKAGDSVDVVDVLNVMIKDARYIADSIDGAFNIASRFGRSFHLGNHEYRYMLRMGKEEWVAEAFQTYYHGNKIMEKFFPEYYKTLINMVDEWLATIPKSIKIALDYLTKIIKDG